MSKKCCGLIFSEDEKFCTVCGKPLVDEEVSTAVAGDISLIQIPDSDEAQDETNYQKMKEKVENDIFARTEKKENEASIEQEETETEAKTEVTETEAETEVTETEAETESVEGEEKEQEIEDSKREEQEKQQDSATEQASDKDTKKKEINFKEEEEEENLDKASKGLVFLGVFSWIIMALGLVVVGLIIYFLYLFPIYEKNQKEPLVFPEIATELDASITNMRPPFIVASETDAETVEVEATATDVEGEVE